MSEAEHLHAGRRAEALACRHLEHKGLRLVTRNYRCPAGELDLVMQEAHSLVVVEVRYRRDRGHGAPAETVGVQKQQRLARTASHYLQAHPRLARRPLRFDVVAVSGDSTAPEIEWITDAFRPA
jgi:putative endonuclease